MAEIRALHGRGLELARLLAGLSEAAWLSVLLVAALHLNPYSRTAFEPDKAAMARTLLLVVVAASIAWWLLAGRPARRGAWRLGGWVAAVLVAWVGSELLSAMLSVAPTLSWVGSYARGQGAWMGIGYVLLFAVVAVEVQNAAQWRRIRFVIAATSVPICGIAVMQRFGGVALASTGDVGGTLGNSTFLAGYLLFPLFVTADFVAEKLAAVSEIEGENRPRWGRVVAALWLPLTVIVLQGITLILTKGSAALLSLATAVGCLALFAALSHRAALPAIAARRGWRWRPAVAAAMVAMLLIAVVFAASVAVGGGRDTSSREQIVRLATLVNPDTATNRVRLSLWDSALQASVAPSRRLDRSRAWWRLLTGYGQETTALVLEPHYPPQLERYEGWQAVPDRAHNQVLEVLLGRGVLGLACYVAAALGFVMIGLRTTGIGMGAASVAPLRTRLLALLLTGTLVAHLVETQFGIAITATESHFWLLGGVLVALGDGRLVLERRSEPAPNGAIGGLLVSLMLATLVFGVIAPALAAPPLVLALVVGSWLCAMLLWSHGGARQGDAWMQSSRFALASVGAALVYVGFHALQLRTAVMLTVRGDEVGAATTRATFFGGYQAWVLVIVVVLGVLLARQPGARGRVSDVELSLRVAHPRWQPARRIGAIGILLALGWMLPRSTAVHHVGADILAAQADAAQRRASYATAAGLYRRALAVRPDAVVYRFGLAGVQAGWASVTRKPEVRDRRFRRGVRQLRHAMRSFISDSTSHANLARLYTRWGELDSRPAQRADHWRLAERQFRAALRRRPGSARYFAESGRLAMLQGEVDLAAEHFLRSLSQDPTSGQTYVWLQPLLSDDLLAGAEVLAELGVEAGDIAPAQIYAALVEYHAQAGDLAEAIRAARNLARSTPDDPTGVRALAVLHQRAGEYDEALVHAQRALVFSTGQQRREVIRLLEALEDQAAQQR